MVNSGVQSFFKVVDVPYRQGRRQKALQAESIYFRNVILQRSIEKWFCPAKKTYSWVSLRFQFAYDHTKLIEPHFAGRIFENPDAPDAGGAFKLTGVDDIDIGNL